MNLDVALTQLRFWIHRKTTEPTQITLLDPFYLKGPPGVTHLSVVHYESLIGVSLKLTLYDTTESTK